jgi:hypothetical protein
MISLPPALVEISTIRHRVTTTLPSTLFMLFVARCLLPTQRFDQSQQEGRGLDIKSF